MNKQNYTNKWLNFFFKVPNHIITEPLIKVCVSSFKEQMTAFLKNNPYPHCVATHPLHIANHNIMYNNRIPLNMNHGKYKLLVLFKIKSIDNTYRTLSLLQILNFEEIDKLTPLFIEY